MTVQVICDDARNLAQHDLPPVQCVVTSPPYNVGIKYSDHDDSMPDVDYFEMLRDVWRACWQAMVPGGRICVNVPMMVMGQAGQDVLFAPLVWETLAQARFQFRTLILWNKTRAAVPNTAWGSWLSASNPHVRDQCEAILVGYKDRPDLPIPKGASLLESSQQFMDLTASLWTFSPDGARQSAGHPVPFPVELPVRCMQLYAYRGAHALDVFAGSGTTGLAALKLGLDCTLFDISPSYCARARLRCAQQPLALYTDVAASV